MKRKAYLKLLFLTVSAFVIVQVHGQSVKYRYDTSGNRTKRELITVRNMTSPSSLKSSTEDVTKDDWDIATAVFTEPAVSSEETMEQLKVKIYPNPTQGKLQVDITGGIIPEKSLLILYTSSGSVIKQQNSISATNVMDISAYPAGIYILRIILGEEASVWKIIKE